MRPKNQAKFSHMLVAGFLKREKFLNFQIINRAPDKYCKNPVIGYN